MLIKFNLIRPYSYKYLREREMRNSSADQSEWRIQHLTGLCSDWSEMCPGFCSDWSDDVRFPVLINQSVFQFFVLICHGVCRGLCFGCSVDIEVAAPIGQKLSSSSF